MQCGEDRAEHNGVEYGDHDQADAKPDPNFILHIFHVAPCVE